jgi:hypothetical protein
MSINNIAAKANENINAAYPLKELSSEAHKFVKNIIGANTDLPISDIIEMLNQVYLVKHMQIFLRLKSFFLILML